MPGDEDCEEWETDFDDYGESKSATTMGTGKPLPKIPPTPTQRRVPSRQIRSDALRLTFSTRNVGLVYTPSGRTIVKVSRGREEPLERAAMDLAVGLQEWLLQQF